MLFELGYMPLITKATRITYHSKTLIDHIYTNTPEKLIKSGICLADITDHLPCFCTFSSAITFYNQQHYFRDFSTFRNNEFTAGLKKMSFVNSVINKSMNNIIKALQSLSDKHAPIKKVSQSKKKTTEQAMDNESYTYFN